MNPWRTTMAKSEFSKPAFQVSREPEGLRISVPVKSERFRTLLNLVWLLVWAAGESAIFWFLLGGFSPAGVTPSASLPLTGLFLAAFTLAGGVVLWRWLWCVGGGETFVVSRNALLATREIWGVGHSRKFDLEKIRSVRAGRLKYRVIYPSWGRMFIGHDESEIVIDCGGRSFAYGKGLEQAEAEELVDLLQEEMGFQFHQKPFPKARSAFLT
jgi:hypothetical protein